MSYAEGVYSMSRVRKVKKCERNRSGRFYFYVGKAGIGRNT